MHPDIHTSDIHSLSHRLLPIPAGPRDQSASLPVPCHAQQGGHSGPGKTEVGSSHGCAQKPVRTGDNKVSLRVTQTQVQPQSVSGHRGLGLSPLPTGLLIPGTSAPGCSRTDTPQPGMLLRCSHRRQTLHPDISVPFSLPGKSKSLLRGCCSGSLAVHAIGKRTMLSSVPELSDLVLHVLFSKMPSFITSRAEIMSHLLASLSNTGIHRHWLWGQGRVLRLWPLRVHSHQKLQHRLRGFRESLGAAGRRALGHRGWCCAGERRSM